MIVCLILLVQIAISFAKIIITSIQPATAVIGRLPGTDAFGDVEQYPMAVNIPGVLIVSLKSSWLCFANANLVEERYLLSPLPLIYYLPVFMGPENFDENLSTH